MVHFPHILAAGLVNQAEQFNQEYPRAKQPGQQEAFEISLGSLPRILLCGQIFC